jgi:nicotinamidase-related amidase
VLQTALSLLRSGLGVYVLADAVSSCNRQEVPVALSRMRQAGAVVSTSESIIFELLGELASTDTGITYRSG